MDGAAVDRLLDEQRRYYRARAPEYDDWWYRRGRYRDEPETAARWLADVCVATCSSSRAGTGLWTKQLLRYANRVTAVDVVADVLEINRARTNGVPEYIVADVFEWEPRRKYDVCFFGLALARAEPPLRGVLAGRRPRAEARWPRLLRRQRQAG
jgi:demethylmenaquinone methyltransferase/2-methoxy-6-polyprenyl-1,4-benzoquinol methylase